MALPIFLTDIIKLSLLKWKESLLWCLMWSVFSCLMVVWFAGIGWKEVRGLLNFDNLLVPAVLEIFLFLFSVFYKVNYHNILHHYPGLMLIVPVAVLAFWLSRISVGINFISAGLISTGLTAVVMTGCVALLKWLRCDRSWLYILSSLSLFIYIIIYGIS